MPMRLPQYEQLCAVSIVQAARPRVVFDNGTSTRSIETKTLPTNTAAVFFVEMMSVTHLYEPMKHSETRRT